MNIEQKMEASGRKDGGKKGGKKGKVRKLLKTYMIFIILSVTFTYSKKLPVKMNTVHSR